MRLTLKSYIEKIENWESIESIYNDYFSRAKDKNNDFNAYISLRDNQDINIEELKNSLLKWAPIALKDNFMIKWEVCTCWSKMLEKYISPYNCTIYNKLKDNWALILWKTNMDEFAMWSSTETSFFWVTKNPYDKSKVPWWSSGGSAAAVAADMCIAALGTDTWWSIRQPASFCGVVWFKPTYWRNSRYGIVAMASSLDQVGSLTKNVEDCVIISKLTAWNDKYDATSIEKSDLHLWDEALQKNTIKGMKIAVPEEFIGDWVDNWVKDIILSSIEKAKKLWAEINYVSMPVLKHCVEVYYIVMPAEVSTNLSRFDGIRYWYWENSFNCDNLDEYYSKIRSIWFGTEVKRRIMMGTYVLSAWYYEAFYNKAQKIRKLIKQSFDQIFEENDLIIWPVTPTTAWNIWEKIWDPLQMYLSDIFTIPSNLAWLPAMSLPAGTSNKMPVWLHIMANQWNEDKIFQFANVFEKNK